MEENNSNNPGVFDTHKFLYTLYYNNEINPNLKVEFLDRNNEQKTIALKDIEISASPVSCKLYDENNERYIVPFIRVRKIFDGEELIWDNTEADISNVKVIKGYE